MNFKARAAKPGACAWSGCSNQAQKIYEDGQWRLLACSQAHAEIARGEIDKLTPGERYVFFGGPKCAL